MDLSIARSCNVIRIEVVPGDWERQSDHLPVLSSVDETLSMWIQSPRISKGKRRRIDLQGLAKNELEVLLPKLRNQFDAVETRAQLNAAAQYFLYSFVKPLLL